MAQTPVQLKVKDFKEREVMHFFYEFDQKVDVEGQMAGIPRGGFITIKVKALNDGNADLLNWMIAPNMAKDGAIELNETKSGNLMKKIEFKDAYCIHFIEDWEEGIGHIEEIKISCREITNGSVTYTNKWS